MSWFSSSQYGTHWPLRSLSTQGLRRKELVRACKDPLEDLTCMGGAPRCMGRLGGGEQPALLLERSHLKPALSMLPESPTRHMQRSHAFDRQVATA